MKKILSILAIALFTVTVGAQEAKTVVKAKTNTEACCAKKTSEAKLMSADEIAQCKIKCNAEGKKCDVAVNNTEGGNCSSETMTATEISKCQAKCKAEGKKCEAKMAATEEKKCCDKKA
jgi:uncharacterized protein YraI